MNKKLYISPELNVYLLECEGLLSTSRGSELDPNFGVKGDYTEAPACTNKKQWDELSGMQKGIWE